MTGTDESTGLIMAAVGAPHVAAANRALGTFRRHAPGLAACLFTDRPDLAEGWTETRVLTAAHSRSKVDVLPQSPYVRTLYVDTDTLALTDVTPVFALLERFDLAIAHVALWQRPGQNRRLEGEVPYVFPQLNSGVIVYRKDGAGGRLLADWAAAYHRGRAEKGLRTDQTTLREAMWARPDLRLYVLPPQWNKRVFEASELLYSDLPRPVILHLLALRPPKSAWQRAVYRFVHWAAPRRWRHPRGLAPDLR